MARFHREFGLNSSAAALCALWFHTVH
jgi:hypothetical protein